MGRHTSTPPEPGNEGEPTGRRVYRMNAERPRTAPVADRREGRAKPGRRRVVATAASALLVVGVAAGVSQALPDGPTGSGTTTLLVPAAYSQPAGSRSASPSSSTADASRHSLRHSPWSWFHFYFGHKKPAPVAPPTTASPTASMTASTTPTTSTTAPTSSTTAPTSSATTPTSSTTPPTSSSSAPTSTKAPTPPASTTSAPAAPTSSASAPTSSAAPTKTATPPSSSTTKAPVPPASSSTAPVAPTSSAPAAAPAGTFAQQVFDLTNAERAKAGCKALTINPTLTSVAQAHSADMAANGYFSHTSPDGRDPFDRMEDAGYSFRTAGENIAAGQQTPATVMTAWMNSEGHRANILNCSFTQIGVGYATGGSYGKYWTQDFGTPA